MPGAGSAREELGDLIEEFPLGGAVAFDIGGSAHPFGIATLRRHLRSYAASPMAGSALQPPHNLAKCRSEIAVLP
jgi:hypothetical protein